jgi:hypothetical protein
MKAGTLNKYTLTVLLRVGLEHKVPVFEQYKTVNAVDSTATVVGLCHYGSAQVPRRMDGVRSKKRIVTFEG